MNSCGPFMAVRLIKAMVGLNLLRKRICSLLTDVVFRKINLNDSKLTLNLIDYQTLQLQTIEEIVYIFRVLFVVTTFR